MFHIRTSGREKTGLAGTYGTAVTVPAMKSVHVGGRSSHIRYHALELRHPRQQAHLSKYRFLAAAAYKLALMCGYGAETASAETAPVDGQGILYHLIGRYLLALVTRMGLLGKGQAVIRVHLLLCLRRKRRIDPHVSVPVGFDESRGVEPVGLLLLYVEIVYECVGISQDTLEGIEQDTAFRQMLRLALDKIRCLRNISQTLPCLYGPGHRCDGTLAHTVDKTVRPAVHQHGRKQPVLPVIVMGKPS